jgi:hypothetical protein
VFNVEILERIGQKPIVVPASQVVVRMPDGTPISVAALYGSSSSVMVSHCTDKDFQETLGKLGIKEKVIVTQIKV